MEQKYAALIQTPCDVINALNFCLGLLQSEKNDKIEEIDGRILCESRKGSGIDTFSV